MFISADGDISATVLGILLLQLSARLSLKGDFDARRITGLAAQIRHAHAIGAPSNPVFGSRSRSAERPARPARRSCSRDHPARDIAYRLDREGPQSLSKPTRVLAFSTAEERQKLPLQLLVASTSIP
jgi:hypothetical protein